MELSRRDMLKMSAAAGGIAWAAPFLSTGTAWGVDLGCGCDGAVVYAKFAPGNSQTCQNQCLQPGTATRLDFGCLVDNGLISVCDDVNSNDDFASMDFLQGTRPLKVAIKSESNCYIARCNEGFNQLYTWSTSFNNESYTNSTKFTDPATTNDTAMIRVYTGGTSAGGPCKGQVDASGHHTPSGTICGSTNNNSSTDNCSNPITGIVLTTTPINDKLNFIEMELCVTNLSKIPCQPILC